MTDLLEQIDRAATKVRSPWTPEVAARTLVGLERRKVRFVRNRRIAATAAVVGCAALAVVAFGGRWLVPAAQVADRLETLPQPNERVLLLGDGVVATALDDTSVVAIAEDAPTHVAAALRAGRARFAVPKGAPRSFRVSAGRITITALGTVFSVAREAERTAVAVSDGRVRVDFDGGSRELVSGETAWFPDAPAARTLESPNEAPAVRTSARSVTPTRSTWRTLARERRYEESYSALQATPTPARWTAEDLLLAGDAARLSGHPREAVPYLERILREHRADARASQAAFMLGKLLLSIDGRPSEAAQRFAEARALAPSSSLAEDALAREVEAWARAGRTEHARARAHEYLRLHPGGTWAEAMKGHARAP